MKKRMITSDRRCPMDAEQQFSRKFYVTPQSRVLSLGHQSCLLAGSDKAKVNDYEDGEDYSYIPNTVSFIKA